MAILNIKDCGQYGVINDISAVELPNNAWTDALNMRFPSGYAQRIGGYAATYTAPSVVPYALFSYSSSTAKYFVHAGTARVFCDDGTTRTDLTPVTPYAGNIDDRWTGGSFNGLLLINNGVDQPQYWNGNTATKFATLTNWNTNWRCAALRSFKNFIIALDVTKSGVRNSSMVKWSDAADPGALPAWDETVPTNLAGEVSLADSPDALIDAYPLGDQMILYKERSMYAMQLSGDQSVFRITRLPFDVGMLYRGCGAVTPLGHVVLTAGDVILHNGGAPRSLLTDRVRRWLFTRIDSANWRRCYLVANNTSNEVWICFPESGKTDCTLALVWNWTTDTFGVSTLPNTTCGAQGITSFGSPTWNGDTGTWDSDATAWDETMLGDTQVKMLMGATTPLIISYDTSNDFAGAPFTATLTRKHLCVDGDPMRYKLIRSIRPRVDAQVGTVINVQVGATATADVEPTYSTAVPFTVGASIKADVLASGRFHSVKFSSTGTAPWRIKSYDVEFEQEGSY